MELFSSSENIKNTPLAARMRPETLDDFIGQEHLVGKGRLLRRAIQADQLSSLIFYGPPGTGKTTLAKIIAKTTKSSFITINAVLSGVKEIRDAIIEAKKKQELYDKKTILFVDEVHRWNKAQQDALLPWVENGTFILIGATTENPFYEVNSALVSRSRIFQLLPLGEEDLLKAAYKTIENKEKGYGKYKVEFESGALEHIANIANGDARSMLNALELAIETTPEKFPPAEGETIYITIETAGESIQKKALLYDKDGDYHFDTISAFIKSIRGSDPDASLYWMARMLEAGEDPKYIFRRMIISAAEDIGLADPNAIVVANAAAVAYERIGLPEGQLLLSETALYLACAKKSNSVLSIYDAIEAVRNEKQDNIPVNLKDSSRDKDGFGHGKNYLYPHAYRDHWVAQQYLPASLKGRIFYKPGDIGYEGLLKEELFQRREAQLSAHIEKSEEEADTEILTFSPANTKKDKWLNRIAGNKGNILSSIREEIFAPLFIKRHHRILVASPDKGLLVWEAVRHVPEGGVFFTVENKEDEEIIKNAPFPAFEEEKPISLGLPLEKYIENQLTDTEKDLYDIIIGRNIFLKKKDPNAVLSAIYTLIDVTGKISVAENLPGKTTRISELFKTPFLLPEEEKVFTEAENLIYQKTYSELLTEEDYKKLFEKTGFKDIAINIKTWNEVRLVTYFDLEKWFNIDLPKSYGSLLIEALNGNTALFDKIKNEAKEKIAGNEVKWKTAALFITAVK